MELGAHRAPRCEPVVSLVRSRRAPPVPLIVLPKSCSCRWGPCPPPLSLVFRLFSFFLSDRPRVGERGLAHHTPLLKIPVWWRRAVLPSLPWAVCFLSFFRQARHRQVRTGWRVLARSQANEFSPDFLARRREEIFGTLSWVLPSPPPCRDALPAPVPLCRCVSLIDIVTFFFHEEKSQTPRLSQKKIYVFARHCVVAVCRPLIPPWSTWTSCGFIFSFFLFHDTGHGTGAQFSKISLL